MNAISEMMVKEGHPPAVDVQCAHGAGVIESASLNKRQGNVGMIPSQQTVKEMEARIDALRGQQVTSRQQIVSAAGAATSHLAAVHGPATGVQLSDDPKLLAEELELLARAEKYLLYLQELQALLRNVEKLAREAERALTDASDSSYVSVASNAVESFSHGMGYVIAMDQIAEPGSNCLGTALESNARRVLDRVQSTGASLRGMLSTAIQRCLQGLLWPPPVVITAEKSAQTASWNGFSDNEAVFNELQHLFIIQLTLQRVLQHKEFAALGSDGGEAPVLWLAEELATGLGTWLAHHFAGGLPTDRIDKPEWLFAAALKASGQCGHHAEALQPCIDAHGLQPWFSAQLEFARAVGTAAVAPVLRLHVLPRLADVGDTAAWLHFVDEVTRFEKGLAPLRGVGITPMSNVQEEEDALHISATVADANSCINILFEREEWEEGWLAAEREDAERQMDLALEAPDGWRPVSDAVASLQLETPNVMFSVHDSGLGGESKKASDHEFHPPVCAESMLSIIASLVRRGAFLYYAKHRERFDAQVVQPALKGFRPRLAALLIRAEQFDRLMDETSLPSVGGAICAAHYFEHSLREPHGPLLTASVADIALATALEKEAASLATFRRQWAYKLAKLTVDQFQKVFAQYRNHLDHFSVDQAGYISPPQGPSPRLLPAIEVLQSKLQALSTHLDSSIFRDVWRAVALAVNYAAFNEVATEAAFSDAGARQLAVDVDALTAVFGLCTMRPEAHLKESREACLLLGLPVEEAAAIGATARQEGELAKAALVGAGIKALNAEQVGSVLSHRLDMAPRH